MMNRRDILGITAGAGAALALTPELLRALQQGQLIQHARTWPQFFLKYVVSHPAVTVVRTGTTRAEHMLDNIGGGNGRLPDEATRKRMSQRRFCAGAGT